MFFSAYLGNDEDLPHWQEVVRRHAIWLGQNSCFESYRLADGRNFSLGWLKLKLPNGSAQLQEEKEGYLVITTSDGTMYKQTATTIEQLGHQLIESSYANVIRIGVSLRSGELEVVVPPATPEQFYFTRDARGYVLGNDMRLLIRWAGMELDERAIYALFQYGAIPAPLTITKKVQRVPNGHVLKITSNSAEPVFEVFFQPSRELSQERDRADPAMQVQDTLDSILKQIPASAMLYFSGGVDSSLLASRLVEIGRTDVKLLNYAFGTQDPEGHLALQMAKHLGLACEQVMYEPSSVPQVLERLGKDYSFPFGDRSVLPTNLLVHASFPLIGSSLTVVEGTGADGAFGRWIPNSRWSNVPRLGRELIAAGYKWLKIWQNNSEIERLGRFARRSLQMPSKHGAVIAQNSLDGIAYNIPGEIRETLEEVIITRVEILSEALAAEEQLSLLDIVHICAGIFAAKSYDPLRVHGIRAIYPFLEPPMVRLSSSLSANEKCEGGEGKGLLKNLLVRKVPQELVYRPKSGFVPPFQEMLTYPSTQEFVTNVVMSPENPLIDFCQMNVVSQIIEQARQGHSLSIGAHKFLWVLIFTSGWLHQGSS